MNRSMHEILEKSGARKENGFKCDLVLSHCQSFVVVDLTSIGVEDP